MVLNRGFLKGSTYLRANSEKEEDEREEVVEGLVAFINGVRHMVLRSQCAHISAVCT